MENGKVQEAVEIALDLLKNESETHQAASAAFPPEITSLHIQTSVSKYEDEISTASKRSVCCSWGRFVATKNIYKIHHSANILLSLQCYLDHCHQDENS